MKSFQRVYATDFNLGKDITLENEHWFTYALFKKNKNKNKTQNQNQTTKLKQITITKTETEAEI